MHRQPSIVYLYSYFLRCRLLGAPGWGLLTRLFFPALLTNLKSRSEELHSSKLHSPSFPAHALMHLYKLIKLGPMVFILRYSGNTMGSNPGLNLRIESGFLQV